MDQNLNGPQPIFIAYNVHPVAPAGSAMDQGIQGKWLVLSNLTKLTLMAFKLHSS